jgi:DNA-binding Lrp family transcriptional regulator
MQAVSLDSIDRKILDLLQKEPGINASTIGERISLSQSGGTELSRGNGMLRIAG